MTIRRIVIGATALSFLAAIAASTVALSFSAADGDSGQTVAVAATLVLGALAGSAFVALYIIDQRRSANRQSLLQQDVRRTVEVLKEIRSAQRTPAVTAPMLDRRLADTSFQLYRQLEARFILEQMIAPERPLPPLRGWALSPDLAVELVDRVLSGDAQRILETGSGVSTLLFALALRKSRADGKVVAFEHDEQYAEDTRRLLADHGCSDVAEVIHAPLVDISVDGETYRWYDPARLASLSGGFDLLLVDGPPASVGPRSRYPALPMLAGSLAREARIFLDDARREDEQDIVNAWIERHGAEMVAMHRHDKGTAELRIVGPESPAVGSGS